MDIGVITFIYNVWEIIQGFIDFIYWFFTNFLDAISISTQYWIKQLTYLFMWLSYQSMLVAYELATELIDAMDISTYLDIAWSSLDSDVRNMLVFFKIPECVNWVGTAISMKAVMKFMPRFGG